MKQVLAVILACAGIVNLNSAGAQTDPRFQLITVDPGHFHAALVQKFMYADVAPLVHVYAPAGDDLTEHLKRIERFNTRADEPTRWQQQVYTGSDFFARMLADKPGNVVVLSGNNAKKTDYILQSVKAGLNVLADKPMAITSAEFQKLRQAFEIAAEQKVLLYDIMTERFEITTILQRELSLQKELFGELVNGSPAEPAITKESVHHFSKLVAGAPLKRPQWFFDVRQQGEGLVDVTTHLVDLIQWESFPGVILKPDDAKVLTARRWATPLTLTQFKQVTGADAFPDYLKNDVKDGVLQVFGNGEFTYRLREVHAKVSVTWDFEAPPGTGDTHYSIMRGSKANLIIRQGAEQKFKPVLYIETAGATTAAALATNTKRAIEAVAKKFPGVIAEAEGNAWRVSAPEKYHKGHEAHFAQVTENYLRYLREGKLPDWEVPNMITKYATIMQAYELSR
jgi:predicted dehydrogenase